MYKDELRKEVEKSDNNIFEISFIIYKKYKSWICKFKEIYLVVAEKFAKNTSIIIPIVLKKLTSYF